MTPGAPFPETGKSDTTALVLSATVHLLLLAALFFGVQWKSQAPSSVEVEVWRAAPMPSPKPVIRPEPPKPEPRTEPKPEPKPKAESPPPPKPDIAVKDKKKEPPKPEPKKTEPKPEEPDWKKELAKEQKLLDQQKAVQDQRARAAAEANQLAQLKAEQAAAARTRGLADYAAKVRGKIRGNIILPPNIQGNPEGIYEVTQLPSGEIISVKTRKSSGNRMLDDAIERAIKKSNPLPKPDNPAYFERILKIPYRPFEE